MQSTQDQSATALPRDSLVPLETILCTEELNRRPKRPPDYETENRALVSLAQALAESPRTPAATSWTATSPSCSDTSNGVTLICCR
jgi:hypothetical protein